MSHQHIPGMPEHEAEPIPGLPARLPEGEGILWQGGPASWPFTVRAMHLKGLSFYFGLLVVWHVADVMTSGGGWAEGLRALAMASVLGVACLGLLALIGRAMARGAIYTITNRRVVMRVGVALPMTINLPFAAVQSAAVKRQADGTEDIVLELMPEHRVSFIAVWPHLRPWRLGRTAPMLRGLPVTSGASQVLARALAASAAQPVGGVEGSREPTPVRFPGAVVA